MTAALLRPRRSFVGPGLAALTCTALVVIAFAWLQWGHRVTQEKISERVAHWTPILERNVAIGEDRQRAEGWVLETVPRIESSGGTRSSNTLGWYPYTSSSKEEIVAEADMVKTVGLDACDEWVVLVDIHFGPDGKVASREVTRGGGGCL